MNKDNLSVWGLLIGIAFTISAIVLIYGGVAYVVVHFIKKFW